MYKRIPKYRKLRARWSLEAAQDLEAAHGINLTEDIKDEIMAAVIKDMNDVQTNP